MLLLTRVGLRLFGYNRWYTWLESWAQRSAPPAAPADEEDRVRRTRRALYLAIEHGFDRGNRGEICLRRALTMWWLLRRQGIESDLFFGVRRKNSGQFQAHAWLEYQGCALVGDRMAPEFTPFDTPIVPVRNRR